MKVLLIGNTNYVTKEFVTAAFPKQRVFIIGETSLAKKDLKKAGIEVMPYPKKDTDIAEIFQTYEFDRIVYLSNFLAYENPKNGEAEQLVQVLSHVSQQEGAQFVYLTGPQANFEKNSGIKVMVENLESICLYYAKQSRLQVKMLRIPYLYSATYQDDFLYTLFNRVFTSAPIQFNESSKQGLYFMSTDDLAELLYKVFDNWDNKNEILHVYNYFDHTFEELGVWLHKLGHQGSISFKQDAPIVAMQNHDSTLKNKYGWFAKYSILAEIESLYKLFLTKQDAAPATSLFGKLKSNSSFGKRAWKLIELFVSFFIAELLTIMIGNQRYFATIDLRFIFVVIMGSAYGIEMGVIAACLASLALLYSNIIQGASLATLFYSPSNWIPFIAYFITGAICGYIQMKRRDDLEVVKKENDLLREKIIFVRQLYQDVLQEKQELRKQIIGSRDSFGKIFDIIRQLESVHPEEILVRAVQILEDILDCHSIGIYTIGSNQQYAKLNVASQESSQMIRGFIKLSDYDEAMRVLEQNEVWANRQLLPDYPMYMVGIHKNDQLVMIIWIQETEYNQMSLYYFNLLKIVCSLIENSLVGAFNHQETIRQQQYLTNTVMKEEHFLNKLDLYRSLKRNGSFDYELMHIETSNKKLEEIEGLLIEKIHNMDTLGVITTEGLFLILVQPTHDYVETVRQNIELAGMSCSFVEMDAPIYQLINNRKKVG